MWLLKQASPAARTALAYVTVGTLIVIWSGVGFVYLYNYPPDNTAVYYSSTGSLVTGLALVFIGLALGRIGRSARHADIPHVGTPVEVANVPLDSTVTAPAEVTAAPTAVSAPVAVPTSAGIGVVAPPDRAVVAPVKATTPAQDS